jgi:hypothetical protein
MMLAQVHRPLAFARHHSLSAGTTRLTVPHIQRQHPSTTKPCQLVEYRIPLEKGRPVAVTDDEYFIPPGSSADPGILLRPASPTTPFEFPFQMAEETYCDFTLLGGQPKPLVRDSITRVVDLCACVGWS